MMVSSPSPPFTSSGIRAARAFNESLPEPSSTVSSITSGVAKAATVTESLPPSVLIRRFSKPAPVTMNGTRLERVIRSVVTS